VPTADIDPTKTKSIFFIRAVIQYFSWQDKTDDVTKMTQLLRDVTKKARSLQAPYILITRYIDNEIYWCCLSQQQLPACSFLMVFGGQAGQSFQAIFLSKISTTWSAYQQVKTHVLGLSTCSCARHAPPHPSSTLMTSPWWRSFLFVCKSLWNPLLERIREIDGLKH
jgi:hypothetical protein